MRFTKSDVPMEKYTNKRALDACSWECDPSRNTYKSQYIDKASLTNNGEFCAKEEFRN